MGGSRRGLGVHCPYRAHCRAYDGHYSGFFPFFFVKVEIFFGFLSISKSRYQHRPSVKVKWHKADFQEHLHIKINVLTQEACYQMKPSHSPEGTMRLEPTHFFLPL